MIVKNRSLLTFGIFIVMAGIMTLAFIYPGHYENSGYKPDGFMDRHGRVYRFDQSGLNEHSDRVNRSEDDVLEMLSSRKPNLVRDAFKARIFREELSKPLVIELCKIIVSGEATEYENPTRFIRWFQENEDEFQKQLPCWMISIEAQRLETLLSNTDFVHLMRGAHSTLGFESDWIYADDPYSSMKGYMLSLCLD